MIAGVGHVESAARGLRAARRRAPRAGSSRPTRTRDLRRHAAPVRGERGRRPRARPAGRPGAPPPGAPRAAHGLERACADTRRRALLDGLDGADVYFAHSFAAEPAGTSASPTVEHEGTVVAAVERGRSRASSSIPSGAAPPARACSRTCCDGQEARDPLPRRRRRPRRQGRPLRVAARRRRPGRARHALLGARRGRARLPRHHGDARGPRPDPRARRARRRGADDPVHRRGRRLRPRGRARAPPRRRRQGRRQPGGRRRPGDPDRARGRVRRPGRRLRDRRARRRGRDARRPDAAGRRRGRVGGARRSSAAPARSCSPRSTPTGPAPATTSS